MNIKTRKFGYNMQVFRRIDALLYGDCNQSIRLLTPPLLLPMSPMLPTFLPTLPSILSPRLALLSPFSPPLSLHLPALRL